MLLASTAAAVPLLAPPAAQAQLVIVNGYEIRTVVGAWGPTGEIEAGGETVNLKSQPWFTGSAESAQFYAAAVGGQLGFPNFPQVPGMFGPFFGYEARTIDNRIFLASVQRDGQLTGTGLPDSIPATWAYAVPVPASSVPGPLPLFGAAAAFGFSRKLRKRIKATRTTAPTRPAG